MIDGKKTIGVLTSGGDAPGMNAAVRAVVRTAIRNGIRVMGIYRGYNGLIHEEIKELNIRDVSGIIHRGGTILYTARCEEFKYEAGLQTAKQTCAKYGIDSIVVIGGDGSFRGARDLSERGVPCVAIPGTIDNDIAASTYTIGYDTAMNTAMDMVDKIRDTAQSHDRCSIVEVMGRHAGHIAISTGIACGATAILVPEVEYDFETDIIERMMAAKSTNKQHFIIIVAEGVAFKPGGITVEELAKKIEKRTKIESRATVLGHVQRGGSPTVRDRVVASQMGYEAVQLLKKDIGSRVVVMKNEEILDYDIVEALKMQKSIDKDLYKIGHEISM